MQYTITGYSPSVNSRCLIYACGCDKEHAEKVLERMLNNPTQQDLKYVNTYSDLQVTTASNENAWWLKNTD